MSRGHIDPAQDGLCFDASGTLIETREPVGAVYRRVALEFGVDLPAWRLDDAFARVLRGLPERGTSGANQQDRRDSERAWWFECIRQTFQATDSTVRFDDFKSFAGTLFDAYGTSEAWRIRSGAREWIQTLRDAAVPLAVVSGFDYRLPDILAGLDLLDLFECLEVPVYSGQAKPNPAVFERVSQELGRSVHHLHYVGDDAPETLSKIAALGICVHAVRNDSLGAHLLEAVG